jgi:predicted enzyme related to lactoylglutathione lyase
MLSAVQLRYLYVGSTDTERDVAAWGAAPGAVVRWRFRRFGADVAAVDLGTPPVILVADHRPAGSVLPIYAVDDLDAAVDELAAHGWRVVARGMPTPEGLAAVLQDGSGVEVALLAVERPFAMDAAYAEDASPYAVRPPAG